MLSRITRLADISRLYVKLSAPCRTGLYMSAHAAFLTRTLGAERLVWGSDWPQTQHEGRVDFAKVVEHRERLGPLNDTKAVGDLYGPSMD
ncbi:amidohydrolase family protein [Roseovarius sp.]|uniref:amidohydrolase family protein n=1 Tax=Roseovarius sp. TaxID=1486281 RepID=UPI00341B4DAD